MRLPERVFRAGSGAGAALSCVGEEQRWAPHDREGPSGLQAGQGHGLWEAGLGSEGGWHATCFRHCWRGDRGGFLGFLVCPEAEPRQPALADRWGTQRAQGPARSEIVAVQREPGACACSPGGVPLCRLAAGWPGPREWEAGGAPARRPEQNPRGVCRRAGHPEAGRPSWASPSSGLGPGAAALQGGSVSRAPVVPPLGPFSLRRVAGGGGLSGVSPAPSADANAQPLRAARAPPDLLEPGNAESAFSAPRPGTVTSEPPRPAGRRQAAARHGARCRSAAVAAGARGGGARGRRRRLDPLSEREIPGIRGRREEGAARGEAQGGGTRGTGQLAAGTLSWGPEVSAGVLGTEAEEGCPGSQRPCPCPSSLQRAEMPPGLPGACGRAPWWAPTRGPGRVLRPAVSAPREASGGRGSGGRRHRASPAAPDPALCLHHPAAPSLSSLPRLREPSSAPPGADRLPPRPPRPQPIPALPGRLPKPVGGGGCGGAQERTEWAGISPCCPTDSGDAKLPRHPKLLRGRAQWHPFPHARPPAHPSPACKPAAAPGGEGLGRPGRRRRGGCRGEGRAWPLGIALVGHRPLGVRTDVRSMSIGGGGGAARAVTTAEPARATSRRRSRSARRCEGAEGPRLSRLRRSPRARAAVRPDAPGPRAELGVLLRRAGYTGILASLDPASSVPSGGQGLPARLLRTRGSGLGPEKQGVSWAGGWGGGLLGFPADTPFCPPAPDLLGISPEASGESLPFSGLRPVARRR
ncbi:collagen alpha-1(III) chain-like [Phyllostomus hastatus]|uniref:collagen alpha-1(III) chain-like n=1 Tax=Phyllostomus hastatus TaxID=9423 RepID=UPI001E681A7B|nr:collagen alpha-1(III) chain-like [Phyllostomus hastatus]